MDKKSCKATFQPYCGKKKSKRKNQNSSCYLHVENILIPVATCKWITSTLMFVKCTNSVNLIRRDGKELLINYKMICKKLPKKSLLKCARIGSRRGQLERHIETSCQATQ